MENEELNLGEEFKAFEKWYQDNLELVNNLQTWVFYKYAQIKGLKEGEEINVEVADMTVYIELFYLSSLHDNKYAFSTSLEKMAKILETDTSIVQTALKSLEEHKLIEYKENGDEIRINIFPISVPHHHHHDHDHHDHEH